MVNIGIGGRLSSGKTNFGLGLVLDLSKYGKEKKIISLVKLYNVEHIYYTNEEFVDLIIKYKDNPEMLKKLFFNSVLYLDEIRNLISARKSTTNLNEAITQFLMMAGKLDCDVVFTYQVYTSQVDLQLREITDHNFETERRDINLKVLSFDQSRKRIPDIPVRILVTLMVFDGDKLIASKIQFAYDPLIYAKYYNTRQLLILDRDKYLKR